MNIRLCKDYDDMSLTAAELICEEVRQRPDSVLGLATGSTPLKTYQLITAAFTRGEVDFSGVTTFNLDEYYPMKPENPCSYHTFMEQNLFSGINIPAARRHIPDGNAADPEEECRRYEASIREAGGIDLQILGLGLNGHIGFNEPADYMTPETHVVTLSQSTRNANARFFRTSDEVPHSALTMGMASILQARKILLLVSGSDKAKALARMADGEVTPQFPASFLNLHADVTVICDRVAGAGLVGRDMLHISTATC